MDRDRSSLRRGQLPFRTAQASLALAFLVVMVVWPLVAILQRSLAGVGATRIAEILSRPAVWKVVGFTIQQAALSVAATLAVGLPIAHGLARYEFRGRAVVRAAVVVPFVLPTVVVAAAFRSLADRLGGFQPSLSAVIAAHVFFNVAVVVRVVGGAWARLDPRQLDAARALGASPFQAFRRVTLPSIAPAVFASTALVFLFCFTSYGVILVLGGPTRATLETEIQRYAVFRQEFDVAAVLAVVQMAVVAMLALAGARFQRGVGAGRGRDAPRQRPDTLRRRATVAAVVALVLVVVVSPVAALVETSLRSGGGYGLANYVRLTEANEALPIPPARALLNSLGFAAFAAVVASGCALVVARSIAAGGRIGRVTALISLIPLGVSAVTLGFGYLVGFSRFDLRRSVWLIPLAHAVVGLPFVLASVVPALRSIPDRLRQVAATLGASPAQVTRRVERPIIRKALWSGAGFAFAVSVGEFGATSFLARGPSGFTAPLAVFRLLGRPGDILRGQAMALSVVIGLIVGLVALVLERRGDLG